MGCCVSATDDRKNKDLASSVSCQNRASQSQLPVFEEEEEAVKEVLSETRTLKSSVVDEKKTRFQNPDLGKVSEDALFPANSGSFFRSDQKEDEASEVSEILTISENVSTVTVNDGKRESAEEEEEVMQQPKQRMKQRSPAKSGLGVSGNRSNNSNYYPPRRSGQSPAKFTGPARLVQSERDCGGGGRLTGSRSGSFRKDAGERSGRRSRSPATNRNVMGPTSVGTRRNNQSPGRVRLDPKERKVEQYGKRGNSGMNNHNSSGRELLENPLVSLECFIFL